jgi:hypothetical protein
MAMEVQLGREPIHQTISICEGEITPGHVMMWVLIIALIGVVFHGPHDKSKISSPHSQGDSCP